MGSLDASVMCRCVQDGVVELPKQFKKYYLQEKNGSLIENESSKKKALSLKNYITWSRSCCEHNSLIINIEIGRFRIMMEYVETLEDLAAKNNMHAKLLLALIPQYEGSTSAKDALTIQNSVDLIMPQLDAEDRYTLFVLENIKKACHASIATQNYISWF